MKKVDCTSCPCLNNDADYGLSCNLGFKIFDIAFFGGATSNDCKLLSIEFVNDKDEVEKFIPEIELEN